MTTSTETIQIDLRRWLYQLLPYWWLILLSVGLAWVLAYLYLRYTTYEYRASAIILVKDGGGESLLSEESILLSQDFRTGKKGMDNEMQILQSSPLMQQVVERLGIQVSYFRQGKFKEQEFYHNKPFSIDSLELNGEKANFFVELVDNDHYLVKGTAEAEDGIRGTYGDLVPTFFGRLQLRAAHPDAIIPGVYRVQVLPTEPVADRYRSRLRVERIGGVFSSGLLSLALKDPVPSKAEDVLRTLIQVYNEEEIRDENQVLRNTLAFIDARLDLLEGELDAVESDIEQFRKRNALVRETAAASRSFAVDELRATLNDISRLETQMDLLRSLEALVRQRDSIALVPANLVAENPAVGNLVNMYNQLVLEWQRLNDIASPRNPARIALEEELADLRISLLESIRNAQADLAIPLQRLQRTATELERNMQRVPTIEKELIERKRLQAIKEDLYLTLLQKREETALSIAVATSGNRVVEPPRSSAGPVYPKEQLVYIGAVLLGLLLPIFGLTLYHWLDNRVVSEDTVKRLSSLPIYGRIGLHHEKSELVVRAGSRSAINEMFRQLRTNLNYLQVDQVEKTLAITSYTAGEGKSFIALNLALTYAMTKRKTLLLELDLRKPKLATYLGQAKASPGICDVLVGERSLEEVTWQYQGLDIITSGPIPPNPSELIGSERMRQLLAELEQQYDQIIIDNAPIGLVSDALLLRRSVARFLIVVRHRYTKRSMLEHLEEMHQQGELPNAGLILNGIRFGRGRYYGYHAYGYRAGYYAEN
ncbi:MAG: polysaccharide biosynthesis tyrosine autokinase [Bacteroidetes bacterium]|nr:MAG: polysaccharide biosynthesis tyrosine autokinase [Bacteroidota bacterium]